jgi:hypothetical protein
MHDIRFGGARPTHIIEAADEVTDQQVAEVVARITDGGLPVVLPRGWSVHPIEYSGTPRQSWIDRSPPPSIAFLLVALAGFLVGVIAAALGFGIVFGGII